MQTLKIKNFGPIGENKEEKEGLFTVPITPVTVFIGETASGKSTVAKLYSIFSWLEKKLVLQDIPINLNIEVFKNLCRQQEIGEYFQAVTVIEYEGEAFVFRYDEKNQKLTSERKDLCDYVLPKIQYISAARNLLTILYTINSPMIASGDGNVLTLASNIPFMVNDLNSEYIRSLKKIAKDGFDLPVAKTRVFHQNHATFIQTNTKKISMSSASSGIQSITPLLLVSRFLSDEVKRNLFEKLQDTNENIKNKMRSELRKQRDSSLLEKFNLYCMGGKKIFQADADVEMLETTIKKFIPSCFINIVEEPEQNLFPDAQAAILYTLLEYKNSSKHNKLIFSTHSPYFLTALNNAIFAHEVFSKTRKTIPQVQKTQLLPFEQVSAYKCENGKIISIMDKESQLIDASQIDECSIKINDTFDALLELQNG